MDWLHQWFKGITRWQPTNVDKEHITWLRIYGVPCHACNVDFLEFIVKPVGVFMCVEYDVREKAKMDADRIMVRTRRSMVLINILNVNINGVFLKLEMVEDSHGLLKIVFLEG